MKTPEELFEENRNLVKNTIYKLLKNPVSIAKSKNLDFEDLMQIGTIGLWMACQNYDETKGRTFKNFAIYHIRWELIKRIEQEGRLFSFRGNKKSTYELKDSVEVSSLDCKLKNDEESNTYHDIIGNGYNLEHDAINKETVRYIEENIDPDILDMIKMKSKNKTLAEIGKKFGLSGERVRQKIVSVRKQLENTGWEAFN